MILLDTSALIEIADGSEKGKKIKQFLEKSTESYGATTFSVHELLLPTSGEEQEILKKLLAGFALFSFDYESALESVRLESQMAKTGEILSKIDLFIASICKVKKASFITLDSDFLRVPDLQVINV